MIPTGPLRLRNRLAAMILCALRDENARGELQRLAANPDVIRSWDAAPEYGELLTARARAAADALAETPLIAADASLDQALAGAALLFEAGLHFEVHELLEPYWVRAAGGEREALQGLIQVSVGCQHLANGNLEGARALLHEGALRLRRGHIPDFDLEPFAAAVAAVVPRLGGGSVTIPAFPRGGSRRETWISS